MKNENLPRGRSILGFKTAERKTGIRPRGTPIDTYPPTVEPAIVSNRIITDTPVREKELAPPPRKEEAAKANQGEYAGSTRTVEKVGGNRVLKVALAGSAVVAGGAIAYETVPAVHQAVDSTFLDHIKGKFLSAEATKNPKVFENSASKGTLSHENTIIVSNLESLQGINTISQSSDDGHTVNILMPLQGMPPSGKVDYSRDLVGKNSNNPIYDPKSRRYALENGIENEIVLKNIPAGYTILAPVDGEFMYNRIRSNTPEGTIDGTTFFFKENGILYQILISDASGNTLAPILDVPFRTMKNARDGYRKFLHPIKKGEPIATLLQQGDIDIFAQAWPSGQFGIGKSSNGDPLRPVNISFLTDQQKLVLLEK